MILDLGLPTVCGHARSCAGCAPQDRCPIIVLTALGTESDRVLGLELGADDYVTKPFSMAELMSRVRAILRRCELEASRSEPVRTIGGLRIDLGRHQVLVDGHSVYLTASQFKLLALLAEHPGEVVSRHGDHAPALGVSDYVGDEHVCDVHVSNLRHKIERDPSHPQRIVTMRGVGYKLVHRGSDASFGGLPQQIERNLARALSRSARRCGRSDRRSACVSRSPAR